MIIVYGTRYYGKVRASGGSFLKTQFAHLYYVPLIPIGTHLVLEELADGSFKGIKTALSWRSVFAAYLRVWGPIATLAAVGCGLSAFSDFRDDGLATLVVGGFTAVVVLALLVGTVLGWAVVGKLSAEEQRKRRVYALHLGYHVDPADLGEARHAFREGLMRTVASRARGLASMGYRMNADPAVAWPTFLVVYEFLRADAPRREFLHRTRWLLLLLAFSAGAIALALATAGRLTPGTQTGNDLSFNPAILHFAGLLALVIGLPVWLAQAPAAFRDYLTALRKRRILTFVLSALALGAATALALTFRNPHQWNRDLFWDGCTFTLLRNWPLVWLDAHPWLRAASGLNLVLMAVALSFTFMRQPHRLGLWLALAFGALQPFTNSLVEPRYFIPVFAFVLLFLDLPPVTTRRLTLWWLFLCLVHAPFIARGLSLW
jgi:hypothetical protein